MRKLGKSIFRPFAELIAASTFLVMLFPLNIIGRWNGTNGIGEMGSIGWVLVALIVIFSLFVAYIVGNLCEGVPVHQSLDRICQKLILRIFWYLGFIVFLVCVINALFLYISFLFGKEGALIAASHILGSIAVLIILSFFTNSLEKRINERLQRQRLEGASIALGVKIEDLDSEAVYPEFIKLLAGMHSSELLRNRVADICGLIIGAWANIGKAFQVLVFLLVLWYTSTENTNYAMYAWIAVVIEIAIPLVALPASYACRLATGRIPGEPKRTRKAISGIIETNAMA